jgi:hypothetical protein
MAAGQRLVEVFACRGGVVALRGPRGQQRLGGDAVLGLADELLVGAVLQELDRCERADLDLLHLLLPLLGHGRGVYSPRQVGLRAAP